MGALETLYKLVYGAGPGQPGGKLREAPNRLQMYALEKLMRGANAVGDYHDWMNDLDAQGRAKESPSFDEAYMTPEDRERIEYFRKKYRETTGKELNIPATSTAVSGGPASGGIAPPTDVVAAEKRGETAGDRAISAYKAADKTGGDYTDFSSFMADYVRRAERDTAAEEQSRRDNSVNIDIPGGYESLQRIRQQAGGTPGGGSFSAMESTVVGGDTEEDMRAYVDNYRNTEVDRQIGLIEQAFPAANRPPALDARLGALYEARANRDKQSTERMMIPLRGRELDIEERKANALENYYTGTVEAQMQGNEVDLAREYMKTQMTPSQLIESFKPVLDNLDQTASPNAARAKTEIIQAAGTSKTYEEAANKVSAILQKYKIGDYESVPGGTAQMGQNPESMSPIDAYLFATE